MAIKRFEANVRPAKDSDRVAFQRVQFVVNGEVIDIKTVPAEGGPVQSKSFDLPSDQDNVLEMWVTPVDQSGKPAPAPAITSKVFQGEDTIPPETPEPSDFEIVDATADEAAPATETIP